MHWSNRTLLSCLQMCIHKNSSGLSKSWHSHLCIKQNFTCLHQIWGAQNLVPEGIHLGFATMWGQLVSSHRECIWVRRLFALAWVTWSLQVAPCISPHQVHHIGMHSVHQQRWCKEAILATCNLSTQEHHTQNHYQESKTSITSI